MRNKFSYLSMLVWLGTDLQPYLLSAAVTVSVMYDDARLRHHTIGHVLVLVIFYDWYGMWVMGWCGVCGM
jgi:hypothetical protein